MPERDRPFTAVMDQGCAFAQRFAWWSSSACRPIATSPGKASEPLLVEDLRDEAHLANDGQSALIGHGNPGHPRRGAGARTGRSTRDARRPAPPSVCRRLRTSEALPGASQVRQLHSQQGSAAGHPHRTEWHAEIERERTNGAGGFRRARDAHDRPLHRSARAGRPRARPAHRRPRSAASAADGMTALRDVVTRVESGARARGTRRAAPRARGRETQGLLPRPP